MERSTEHDGALKHSGWPEARPETQNTECSSDGCENSDTPVDMEVIASPNGYEVEVECPACGASTYVTVA